MKIIFAGPSLFGTTLSHPEIAFRPPVEQGDIVAAVNHGANVLGLIDGHFSQVASVWHKEILFALSEGVTIFGGASMGALRAAECQAYGMIPVGEVARRYCNGELDDDAAVALNTGPAELGFIPLTLPLVDVDATIEALAALELITPAERRALLACARNIHFQDRTSAALFRQAGLSDERLQVFDRHIVKLKQRDALEVVSKVHEQEDARAPRPGWRFNPSPFWQNAFVAMQTSA